MKELTEVPHWLKTLMVNKEFKKKMGKHLDNRRTKANQLGIGQIEETSPTEKSFMDNDEKNLTEKCH